MRNNRLLIADSNSTMTDALQGYLFKSHEFQFAGLAKDGIQALSMIRKNAPDIVLMDLLLPEMDGISLLKEIQKLKNPPVVICYSEFYTSASIEAARKNGASYFLCKPVSLKNLKSVLLDYMTIARETADFAEKQLAAGESDERTMRIYSVMHSLGFSSKYCGSIYIAESVALAMDSPMIMHNLSSGLYMELSARMRVSPGSIERSMRTAIAATDSDGHLSAQIGSSPSNKVCIQYILNMCH